MPLQSGQTLHNRYRIVQLLGQGGFGAVYRAWDLHLKRPCAVKENFDATPEAARQFEQEALLLANLSHPNLPRVTDHFVLAGQGQYLIMDFVEGEDLQTKINQAGRLPEREVLPWIDQIGEALTYLHTQASPIIHRDIKPANIRITPDGRAMLVDFGIAKRYDAQAKTALGAQAVTPGFSPLEQYGQGRTDARSDVYALGATLYAALTGQEPVESVQRTSRNPLLPPRQLAPTISPHLETALLKALELVSDARFQTVAAFQQALRPPTRFGQSGVIAVPPSILSPPTVVTKPGGVLWAAGGGLFFLAGLFAVWMIFNAQNPLPSPAPALLVTPIPSTPSPVPSLSPTPSLPTPFTTTPTTTPLPTPTLTPTPTPGPFLNPVDNAPLIFIPGGEFIMGITLAQLDTLMSLCPACERSLLNHSRPTHPTQVDAFWLYQTEVTNAQYAACVQAGFCTPPTKFSVADRSAYYGNPDYAAYPVVYVTWYAADAYCEWAQGRLPTEAEWERAARGDDGRLFPWGDAAPTPLLANIDPYVGTTTAVGAYPGGASPYGVLDMAGNVWEWVADWYAPDYYLHAPLLNPLGPESSPEGQRAGRGGNWAWDNVYASAAYHDYWEPEKSGGAVGFRCVVPQE